MNDLIKAMTTVYDTGQEMQAYADDAVLQEKYRSAVEIYTKKLELNMELAHAFLRQNREINNKIFNDAMIYLDYAIEYADKDLAESALKLIETIKKSEPDFYKNYYRIMFGK
ncbi:MAG: hypothetical protein ACI4K5_02355 [Ruminococcus sp.]|nr:hypothetical protein [Ruminococcus callidus]